MYVKYINWSHNTIICLEHLNVCWHVCTYVCVPTKYCLAVSLFIACIVVDWHGIFNLENCLNSEKLCVKMYACNFRG